MPRPPRLIDLHCDWLLQYVPETNVFDPTLYPEIAAQAGQERGPYLGQTEGYLGGTAAAVVACYRRADDWAKQPDPWQALGALIARVEAEFPGRLLIGPEDDARWTSDLQADGLCWAMLGVEGFDPLIREADDLDRLPRLFDRGVRLFQMTYTPTSLLAGSSAPDDDRGLTDLGRAFLARLADLGPPPGEIGPRAVVDLAHLNPASMADVLTWFEDDPARASRLGLAYSHGGLALAPDAPPRLLTPDNLRRLRALGGTIGLTPAPAFHPSPDDLKAAFETAAAVPFQGASGFAGLGLGTDILGVSALLPGLGNVEQINRWLLASFGPETARQLGHDNPRALIERAVGLTA